MSASPKDDAVTGTVLFVFADVVIARL